MSTDVRKHLIGLLDSNRPQSICEDTSASLAHTQCGMQHLYSVCLLDCDLCETDRISLHEHALLSLVRLARTHSISVTAHTPAFLKVLKFCRTCRHPHLSSRHTRFTADNGTIFLAAKSPRRAPHHGLNLFSRNSIWQVALVVQHCDRHAVQ